MADSMTEHDGDSERVPLARPVVVTARPVLASGGSMVVSGVMSIRCAWIDLAWMLIPVALYMGLIEGVLAEFTVKLSPDEPIPVHVLVGGMGLRLMLIVGLAWWRLTRAGHTGDVIGLSLHRGWAEAMLGVPTVVLTQSRALSPLGIDASAQLVTLPARSARSWTSKERVSPGANWPGSQRIAPPVRWPAGVLFR